MVVEAFFWRGRTHPPQEIQKLSDLTLLSGPPSSGKTSLLFQFAFNVALAYTNSTTPNVVFICNRHRLDSKPPFLSQGIDASSDVFHHIQMKYMNDDEDIKKYFSAFHLYDTLPAAVIIDDFGDFFGNRICQERYSNPRGRDLAMVRSLALCHNAITYANQKRSCKLLLSDTYHGDSPRLHFIYKKWIPTIFTIKEGDESGSFILKDRSYSGTDNPGRIKVAKYSIALQYLFLERIFEDQKDIKIKHFFRKISDMVDSDSDEPSLNTMTTISRHYFGDNPEKPDFCISIIENMKEDYGLFVWPCSIVLAEYVWQQKQRFSGVSVVELGAGTSLPGLVAAKVGADVTLTDDLNRLEVLDNMRRVCNLNKLECNVLGLTWGVWDTSMFSLQPKIILGADVLYESNAFDDLFATVTFLLQNSPGSIFITSYHNRSGHHLIEFLMVKWGLKCVKLLDGFSFLPHHKASNLSGNIQLAEIALISENNA